MIVIPQPDLGTGLVYVAIGFAVLFFAGTSWRQLGGARRAVRGRDRDRAGRGARARRPRAKCYQVQRLTAFLNPLDAVRRAPRPTTRSSSRSSRSAPGRRPAAAIHATQTKLGLPPGQHTDFVFASLGEIYGFVGCAIVLSLYALLIWRALRILTMSKNLFGTLIAGGILAMLMFQVFVNVGMTIGIMPITGVPLPLMSYGGSSVIVTFIGDRAAAVDLHPGARSPRRSRQEPQRYFLRSRAPAPEARRRDFQRTERKLKKQVLVSVDRGETRVALLEATGTPSRLASPPAAQRPPAP